MIDYSAETAEELIVDAKLYALRDGKSWIMRRPDGRFSIVNPYSDSVTKHYLFKMEWTLVKSIEAQAVIVGERRGLAFDTLRVSNVARSIKWHPKGLSSWSPSDWLVAAMGELGELAGEVKMSNRERDGLPGNKEEITPEERKHRMANEAADVVMYLDLFCAERGIDLGAAVVRKFNEVSVRVGFPDRINLEAP